MSAEDAEHIEDVVEHPVEDVVADPANEGDEAPVIDPIEELAKKAGWKPESEWKGDKSGWTKPDEFLLLKAEKAKEANADIREMRERMDRLARTSDLIARREAERAVAEARQDWEAAVDAGDKRAAWAASQKLANVEQVAAEHINQPVEPAEVVSFKRDNSSWFLTDPVATQVAVAVADRMALQGATPAAQLAAARDEVLRRFPEYRPASAREERQPPAVSSPTRTAAPRQTLASKLPPEARQAGERFVKQGVFKTLDDYAKVYNEENA